MNIKQKIKKIKFIRDIYFLTQPLRSSFSINLVKIFRQYIWFLKTLSKFKKFKNKNIVSIEYYPCLFDNISYTPLDPVYFYQDTWAARKIFELKPKHHVDVGSSVKTMGILSQFVPITIVDIRPIQLKLKGLNFIKGSILNLPFKDRSLESISSLCVVEHIGLGRYGDDIDVYGSEKAIKELKRVVKEGG